MKNQNLVDMLRGIYEIRALDDKTYKIKRETEPRYAIVVDKGLELLSVYDIKSGNAVFNTPCSTGTGKPSDGFSGITNNGLFEILKIEDTSNERWEQQPSRMPYGPFRFSYDNPRDFPDKPAGGIHGTDEPQKLGTPVSHGCIRVSNDAVRTLHRDYVVIGTPVVVFGG